MLSIFAVILFIFLILEGSISALPLVLIALLNIVIVRRDSTVFVAAFLIGILLDIFALRAIGQTSIFFLFFVLLILLYQRKYEINSYPFVFFAAFFGSLFYIIIFGGSNLILLALCNAFIAILLYGITRLLVQSPLLHHSKGLHYK